MIDDELLGSVRALAASTGRAASARALAGWLATDHLLIAVKDPEVGAVLPAVGFPPTLPDGLRWQDFFAECLARGRGAATLVFPGASEATPVIGIRIADDAVLSVAVPVDQPRLDAAVRVLALVAPLFALERARRNVDAALAATRKVADEAMTLASALDRSRGELQRALGDAEAARRAAEEAHRAKDAFLAVVSHELRTPLNAIVGYCALLRRGRFDDRERAHAVAVIERNARAQGQIVDDLLDFARTTTGKLSLDMEHVEVEPIIRNAVHTVGPAADAKGLELVLELDVVGVSVLGDASRLEQVVLNLLTNAIKFSPRGGRILVRAECAGSEVTIAVADKGIGIEPEALPWIFEPFRQVGIGSSRSHGGLGLGLSIVRHLAQAHGGRVTAHSAGRGSGSTFVVTLPVATAAGPGPTPAARHDGTIHHAIAGARVLLVDDHDDSREVAAEMLRRHGAEVIAVGSAAAALRALDDGTVDVLLCDLEMPGRDGYSLLADVRARHAGLPAAAVTAYADAAHHARALAAGFERFVRKPVEIERLVQVVEELLRRDVRRIAAS